MRRSAAFMFFVAVIALGCNAYARDGARISAHTDKRSMYIGDSLHYVVEVSVPEKTEVHLPEFVDGKIGEFEIRGRKTSIKTGFFTGAVKVYAIELTVFSTGDMVIPPVEIRYKFSGAKDWNTAATKEVPVKVNSLLPAGKPAADIMGIKGPVQYRETNWTLISVILALLIVTGLAVWAYVRHRMRRPVKLPHETALEELESMRGELARTSDIKRYYAGVSDAVRNYIERIFSLKAPEMTTEEFLDSMRDAPRLSIEHKRLLREFLASCDLVKFANYAPKHDEAEAVIVAAKNFVAETRAEGEAEMRK